MPLGYKCSLQRRASKTTSSDGRRQHEPHGDKGPSAGHSDVVESTRAFDQTVWRVPEKYMLKHVIYVFTKKLHMGAEHVFTPQLSTTFGFTEYYAMIRLNVMKLGICSCVFSLLLFSHRIRLKNTLFRCKTLDASQVIRGLSHSYSARTLWLRRTKSFAFFSDASAHSLNAVIPGDTCVCALYYDRYSSTVQTPNLVRSRDVGSICVCISSMH